LLLCSESRAKLPRTVVPLDKRFAGVQTLYSFQRRAHLARNERNTAHELTAAKLAIAGIR
jgi:hypothetical protein